MKARGAALAEDGQRLLDSEATINTTIGEITSFFGIDLHREKGASKDGTR